MQSLRTVYIYGKLAKQCGIKSVQLRGDTVAELIEGLSANFKDQLKPTVDNPRLVCRVKGYDSKQSLYEYLPEEVEEIHLYPTLLGGGGGGGGIFKIFIGVVIIATVFLAGPLAGAWGLFVAGSTGSLTALGMVALNVGVGLILGGVMELMMPQPKMDLSAANDVQASKYLGANQNTIKIGTPIPLLFGRHKAYGHYISFNVDAVDVAAV